MKVFIKNTSKTILLLQKKTKEVFCKLNPEQISFEAFEEEEIKYNPYLQALLSKGMISLEKERFQTTNRYKQNFGQKYLIGTRCEIKGDHHLVITIEDYIPQTAQYKAKLEKSGGIMTLTEKEIIPLSKETIAKENNNQENVDIVINNEGVKDTKVKSVQEIMKESYNNIDNSDYETPQIINTSETQPLPQEPEEDIYIVRNKDTNEKFAKEVIASKMINDSIKATNQVMNEMVLGTKNQETSVDMENVPSHLKNWFINFLNKEPRKQKIAISSCKDKEKLNLIIEKCDEYLVDLAKQKIAILG